MLRELLGTVPAWMRRSTFALAAILALASAAGVAQDVPDGRIGVTYRSGGNAQAAVLAVPGGNVVLDGADIPLEDPTAMVLGLYAWDLAPDGSSVLLHRLTISSMSGDLVLRDLTTADEVVVAAPANAQLIASTARLDASGDRVVFQYREEGAADSRHLRLGVWADGASTPLAGDPAYGIVAFAVAADGTVPYLALPLEPRDARPELFVAHLGGGDVQRVGPLPGDAPLAVNPTGTSMTVSDDGSRVAVSTPERSEPPAAFRAWSYGVALPSGDIVVYSIDDRSLDLASVSPDGSTVVLFEPDSGQLWSGAFGDPSALAPLGPPLQVAPGEPVAWSPDGAAIAFADAGPEGFQAYARPIAGGDPVPLTSFGEGLWNGAIQWSR